MIKEKNIQSSEKEEDSYKKSKLGWIPKDWKIRKLQEVSIISGEYGINAPGVDFDENLPKYLRITDINDDGTLRLNNMVSVNDPNSQKYLLQNDDILLARTGASVGKAYRHKQKEYGDLVFAGFLIRFRLNTQVISPTFLHFYLQTNKYWNWVQVMSQRSGQPGINGKEYSVLPIPLPPLPEQQKIATILSKWDNAIDKLTQLIAAKELQKKGLMQQLLTGELRFPGFEDEWEEVKLETVAKFKNGKGHENNVDEDGEYVLVNSKFVASEGKEYKMVSEAYELLKKGTIVMVMSDVPNGKALAKCYLIIEDNKFTLNQRICSLTPKGINTDFLLYQLNRNKFYMKFDGGVGQTNLKKQEVLNCPVLLPKKQEQQKIASVLSAADKEIEILKKELASFQEQKKGLMQVLLTGKVRVR